MSENDKVVVLLTINLQVPSPMDSNRFPLHSEAKDVIEKTHNVNTKFAANLSNVIAELGQTGFLELQRSIHKHTGKKVDRRKLTRLANMQRVRLTLDEIEAIDLYLRESGQPLSALIQQLDLPSALVDHGRLTFVIPSRSDTQHEQRIDVSRWDLRALRSVLEFVTRTGKRFDLSIEDVIFRPDPLQSFGRGVSVDKKEEWYHQCFNYRDTSFVILGSPLASAACELFLCHAFGYDGHRFEGGTKEVVDRPITFLWPHKDKRAEMTRSAFKWNGDHHPLIHNRLREQLLGTDTDRLALIVGDELYEADRVSGVTYGVVVAQAWPNGVVAAAIAGLTGPATFGAATKLSEIHAPHPATKVDEHGPVRVAVVEVQVEYRSHDPKWRSDKRHVDIDDVKTVSRRTWADGSWSDKSAGVR